MLYFYFFFAITNTLLYLTGSFVKTVTVERRPETPEDKLVPRRDESKSSGNGRSDATEKRKGKGKVEQEELGEIEITCRTTKVVIQGWECVLWSFSQKRRVEKGQ